MPDILKSIISYKHEEISAAKALRPWEEVVAAAHDATPVRPFLQSLRQKRDAGQFGLIAEVKKASPSKGLIRADFDPAAIAEAYERGGATCLSVLTDNPSFQGHPDFLRQARAATNLPALRKDFMLETYQVAEARSWGADCILLILSAITDDTARFLIDAAREWQMDALIEVHNREEMDRALALGATAIGINNRNLRNFETRLDVTIDLAIGVPDNVLLVSESGIRTRQDLDLLKKSANVTTVLVGESLMRETDVERATRKLLNG
ncbi:MAG: indole-3-glycerol phosphate synthase TrpC [Hyphomicrobiaceae bacterium]|nr:indole-3-glycerol phosphate synthase TrpC [Hyphomicrobiaceae bacterium]